MFYIFFLCSIFLWELPMIYVIETILPEGCNRDTDVTDARTYFFSVTEHWQKILIVTT